MTAETRQSSDRALSADEGFLTYPIHKVVAVFEDRDAIEAAVEELKQHNFPADEIEALCGIEGEAQMDFEGTRHGALTTLVRAVQHIGPDRTYLERYEKNLHDGHCLIMVRVTNKLRKTLAAEILHKHTQQQVTYFGLLLIEEIR
jgi:hypothetical protein